MSEADEVLCRVEGKVGRITLNRPQAIHALTTNMCVAMIEALQSWQADPAVELVMFDHSGERGFCAGGDIRMLAESGAGDVKLAREFFFTEYRLNHFLFHYPKPTMAIMDGITMGGGVGLAMPCRYRIATERTIFAMPESGIGLFPDVGGGWYLPRMPNHFGFWLALTGARLKAADCEVVGAATHTIAVDRMAEFRGAVFTKPREADGFLSVFTHDPGPAGIDGWRGQVDTHFCQDSVEAVLTSLESSKSAWAKDQLESLSQKSPRALKVAFRLLKRGAVARTFAENMLVEFRVATRVARSPDFLEGVRALIVEKDGAPKWRPALIKDVSDDEIAMIFAALPAHEEWSPLPGSTS